MRLSFNWLKEYIGLKNEPNKVIQALENAGIEVEQINYSNQLDHNIVVAKVTKIYKHPNADKLLIIEVNDIKKVYKIITGATNLSIGDKVPLARPMAVLPSGDKIVNTKIRGIDSEGMLCSEAELELGSQNDSILILSSKYQTGKSLKDIMKNDVTFNVTTPANRSDLLSIIGLTREITAQLHVQPKLPDIVKLKLNPKGKDVIIKDKDLAPRYLLLEVKLNNKISNSPDWIADRLQAVDIRPINSIVDITNYCMVETGQPLHAFDADKVKLPIEVRRAQNKEKVTTLDGIKRTLCSKDLVIADQRGVIALAGVMGSWESQITTNTKRLLIESAIFDGATIRKTALRLGLRTEASSRFERELPLESAYFGISRAAYLLKNIVNVKIKTDIEDYLSTWPWIQHIGVDTLKISKLAGVSLNNNKIISNLGYLGIEARKFDIAAEAKKHLGKPYKFGAKYKTDGINAFDCSYLTDYLYSLIGIWIGHTALGQYETGCPVSVNNLKPGDLVFYEGQIIKSATDHYYTKDRLGSSTRYQLKRNKRVGHNGIYIGKGKVITAAEYKYNDNTWQKLTKPGVIEVNLETFTKNPGYLGARRYIKDLNNIITITTPWWRPDLVIPEDILEEMVKVIGYNQIPISYPVQQLIEKKSNNYWQILYRLKTLLTDLGMFELNTYSFIGENQLKGFEETNRLIKLKNPRSKEQAYLRGSLMPSLVEVVANNARYSKLINCFEISKVFINEGEKQPPKESLHLAIINRSNDQYGYQGVKKAFDAIIKELNVDYDLKEQNISNFYPTRSAKILLNNKEIGYIGEIHPNILESHKIKGSAGYLELDIKLLIDNKKPIIYQTINKYPSIYRDLSILIDKNINWLTIKKFIINSNLANPTFLSDYYNEAMGNRKSLAIRLEFSSLNRTLTEEEANNGLLELIKQLEKKYHIKVR